MSRRKGETTALMKERNSPHAPYVRPRASKGLRSARAFVLRSSWRT